VERDDTAGPNQARDGSDGSSWVREKFQNESADGGIERFVEPKARRIAFDDLHILETGLGDTRSGARNRCGIAVDADDETRWADDRRGQHGNIAHAGAEVEDTLPRADASLTEQPFG
jgi:hypothetical protein